MPKTVIGEKCANCGRTLYGTDFLRGLAELEFYNTWGDAPAERFVHTYDCENAPRRLLVPPSPAPMEGTNDG